MINTLGTINNLSGIPTSRPKEINMVYENLNGEIEALQTLLTDLKLRLTPISINPIDNEDSDVKQQLSCSLAQSLDLSAHKVKSMRVFVIQMIDGLQI